MPIPTKKEIETSLKSAILELEVQLTKALKKNEPFKVSYINEQKEKLEQHLQSLNSLHSSKMEKDVSINKKNFSPQNGYSKNDFNSIKYYIQKLVVEEKNGSFFILNLDNTRNYYFQFFSPDESSTIIIEAVSNNVLSAKDKLSAEKISLLEQEGWVLPENNLPNFQLVFNYHEEDMDTLMKKLKRIAFKVYEVQIDEKVGLSLNFE